MDMATRTLTRCYRFPDVDFEPDLRLLVWKDKSETSLTQHESRLLEVLCYCAGEVISAEPLYEKAFSQIDPYEDASGQHYDINAIFHSLTDKLNRDGKLAIPIEVLPHYGFRVPLPDKTCRTVHQNQLKPSLPAPEEDVPPPYEETPTEKIVKYSVWHKISVAILTLAGVAMIVASTF
ncbi:hypothetical protein ABT57_18115 [Photobacterium ganghwense]|uniref:OmpR/PhoB-type domain-containing protein n=2 Tax=Photobacterium ganghwense TaxID=320778 RepID=A0A0J1H543_9GAMM|nr:hypothetical protein ABT57_18115 [Photobacterium ganghwense]